MWQNEVQDEKLEYMSIIVNVLHNWKKIIHKFGRDKRFICRLFTLWTEV